MTNQVWSRRTRISLLGLILCCSMALLPTVHKLCTLKEFQVYVRIKFKLRLSVNTPHFSSHLGYVSKIPELNPNLLRSCFYKLGILENIVIFPVWPWFK